MNEMVRAALQRRREMYERAGMTDRVQRVDTRLSAAEAGGAPEEEEGVGVDMTPAAQQRADSLGLTAEDFKRRRPSGKTGFTVDDVERIAESRKAATEEEGDD